MLWQHNGAEMIFINLIIYLIVWAAVMLFVAMLFPRKKKRGHH
jgi:hypothetical protein